MTLAEFKRSQGIETINLGQNPKTGRYIADVVNENGNTIRVISTKEFDGKAPVFVYPTEVPDVDLETGEETGEMVTLFVLSNKEAKVALTL